MGSGSPGGHSTINQQSGRPPSGCRGMSRLAGRTRKAMNRELIDAVDRAALARLVSSISRFLTPEQAATAAAGGGVEMLDSRRLGAMWTLDRLWDRVGIGAAIRRIAAGRRLDGDAVERVVFALVARRACEPGSKLAATTWVAQRAAIEGCAAFSDDQAYRAMDFLLDALDEIAAEVARCTRVADT